MKPFEEMISLCVRDFVESLTETDRIEVIDFGSESKPHFGKLVKVDADSKESCVRVVTESKCDMKQSALLSCLKSGFAEFDSPRVLKTVIVITDCRIERTEEILEALKEARACCRVCIVNVSNKPHFASAEANVSCFSAPTESELKATLEQVQELARQSVLMNPHISKCEFQCITTGVLTPVFFDAYPKMRTKKTVLMRGSVLGKLFRQSVCRAEVKNQVPVKILREFYEMKRRNFISPQYKLAGALDVTITVPSLSHIEKPKPKHVRKK